MNHKEVMLRRKKGANVRALWITGLLIHILKYIKSSSIFIYLILL